MAMTACAAKPLTSSICFSVKRRTFWPEDDDGADQIIILQHRYVHERFRVAELGQRGRQFRIGQYIWNVNDIFREHQTR